MIKKEKISFTGSLGTELSGLISYSDHTKHYALFAHCFTCNKNLKMIDTIAEALCSQGFAVLRFDFTGLGNSKGNFEDTNFSTDTDDLLMAAEYMSNKFEPPELLIGHSLGGAAALNAAGRIKSLKAVSTIAAPSEPMHVSHLFEDHIENIRELDDEEAIEIKIAGRPHKFKKDFIIDLQEQDLKGRIGQIKQPLLLFHSPVDRVVGIEQARKIYEAANHPKSFISLNKADHLLSNKVDAEYLARMMATWSEYYIK